MKLSQKGFAHVLLLIILLVGLAAGVYLATSKDPLKLFSRASENKQADLLSQNKKPEFAQGEVLVKLKNPLGKLRFKPGAKALDIDKQAIPVSSLDVSSLPPVFTSLNVKYKIKTIEKVFTGTQSPQQELSKFKSKFAQDISAGKTKINEGEFLQNDLSRIYKLSLEGNPSIEQAVNNLKSDPQVEYAEPNFIFKTQLVPNDPYYTDHYPDLVSSRDSSWNPAYDYQWNLKKINTAGAWDVSTGGGDVIVAVVDTGVDYTHPEFGACTLKQVNNNQCAKIVPGYDFVQCNFYEGNLCKEPQPVDSDPKDENGHGTHVAGIIGAISNNALGIAGINWGVKIMPVRVLNKQGSGALDAIARGILYASANRAKVINMSLGALLFEKPDTLNDVLNYAASVNIVLVAAAGNSDTGIGNGDNGAWPATHPKVIAVGATDYNDVRASFSNYGPKLDIVAPGVNILSLKPAAVQLPNNLGTNYFRASGTSMAAPHVAAVAALILGKHQDLVTGDPVKVRNILLNAADDLGESGFDIFYGYGRLNAGKALSSPNINELPVPIFTSNIPTIPRGWVTTSGSSFVVAWYSDKEQLATIKYRKKGQTDWQTVKDMRGDVKSKIHYFEVDYQDSYSLIEFDIISDGVTDDNSGSHYLIKPGSVLFPASLADNFAVQVTSQDGSKLGGIILKYIIVDKDNHGSKDISAPYLSLVKNSAYDGFVPKQVLEQNFNNYFVSTSGMDEVQITAYSSSGYYGSMQTTLPVVPFGVYKIVSLQLAPLPKTIIGPAPTPVPISTTTPTPVPVLTPLGNCYKGCGSGTQCGRSLVCASAPCPAGRFCAQVLKCLNPACPGDITCGCISPTSPSLPGSIEQPPIENPAL